MNLNSSRGGRYLRRALTAGTALVVGAGMVLVAATQASAAAGCRVTYTVNQWNTGFTANLTVTNLGDPISNWTLQWNFAGNQQITQSWSSEFTQTGQSVSMRNAAWNGSLGTNASTNPGFNANYSGTNAIPTAFTLNGTPCTGQVIGTPTPGPTSPTPGPTSPTPGPTSPTPGPTSPAPNPGQKVDNPYTGARVYVNPDWSARAAAEPGGSRISNQPTGVWLDRIAAINGTTAARGLRSHLDAALQQAAGQPMVVQIVIYNLPGRDCAALASNGELGPTEIGRYRTEYIDPIAAIMGDPRYANLRIVNIIEIDSLPNLVTNTGSRNTATATCNTMLQNGNYVNGVGYALAKLGALANTYNYIDAGHHGWIGWDDNFGASADLFAQAARASGSTVNNVHGFIANTANYSATVEPFLNVTEQNRTSTWIDFNRYVDEQRFAQAFRQRLIQAGFNSNVGMLIDTSRNGWGGSARPTGPVTTGDINAQVNGSRIDRRIHLGNWCNQSGAGLGERPRANPAAGIDAYVWIKPPGESDGSSQFIENDEGKGFDQMCDPTYTGNPRNLNNLSGALPNSPLSGQWFPAQFAQLMQNAFPPL